MLSALSTLSKVLYFRWPFRWGIIRYLGAEAVQDFLAPTSVNPLKNAETLIDPAYIWKTHASQ